MARVRYMNKHQKQAYNLERYPNFSASGSVAGMKKLYYGENALLVRSGSYIYNVPSEIYCAAH